MYFLPPLWFAAHASTESSCLCVWSAFYLVWMEIKKIILESTFTIHFYTIFIYLIRRSDILIAQIHKYQGKTKYFFWRFIQKMYGLYSNQNVVYTTNSCILDRQAHFANVRHVKPPPKLKANAALSSWQLLQNRFRFSLHKNNEEKEGKVCEAVLQKCSTN